MSGDDQEYRVEALLDLKVLNGVECVLVKWKGYADPSENTWEEVKGLQDDFASELAALRAEKIDVATKRKRGRPAKTKQATPLSRPDSPVVQIATDPSPGTTPTKKLSAEDPPATVDVSPAKTPRVVKNRATLSLARAAAAKAVTQHAKVRAKASAAQAAPTSTPQVETVIAPAAVAPAAVAPAAAAAAAATEDEEETAEEETVVSAPMVAESEKAPEPLFNKPPTKLARVPDREPAEVETESPPDAGEPERAARTADSLDSPLLEPNDVGGDGVVEPTPAPTEPPAGRMLLPVWNKTVFKTPAPPSVEKSPAETVEEPMEKSAGAETAPTEVMTESEPEAAAPPARRQPKRKLESVSAAAAKKRARRKAESEDEYEDSEEQTAAVKVAPKARRTTSAVSKRAETMRQQRKGNRSPSESPMVYTSAPTYTSPPVTAPVTLLSPEFLRNIIREELERHRQLSRVEREVVVRHIGAPPPGCERGPSAKSDWGLVEDRQTGKQIYIPLDDVRKNHSHALVDYLMITKNLSA